MTARLICVGDIHLGRRPSRISPGLAAYRREATALGPVVAWRNTVDWAVANPVDAVVLAGDVVDRYDDRFEAYGHLESGVKQLVDAGIVVCGVVGNHDVEALPRLADRIPDFHLLGAGGCWQALVVSARSGGEVRLLGWSFPSAHFRDDPLEGLDERFDDSTPTIGILHCDLDASGSSYAPVARAELEATTVDAWLLGHIHKPSDLSGPRPIGYLGSLVGLDPGETGCHGPWLVEVAGRREVKLTQIPLAPLRWDLIEIDASEFDLVEPEELEDQIAAAIVEAFQGLHRRLASSLAETSAVGCRIRLSGRARHHRGLRLVLEKSSLADLHYVCDDVVYFVESLRDHAAPALDLSELAKSSDPPGLLARRILELRSESPQARELVAQAERRLRAVTGRSTAWSALGPSEHVDFDVRLLLLRAGLEALEELLAQDSDSSGGGVP